jgi:hypothetical protein
MVGIHDYIIVQPESTNTFSHGFSVYKSKMYAYVSIGEMSVDTKEYNSIDKAWVLSENKAWQSKVMDIKNPMYQKFLFEKMIEPRIKQGFENFFFDTLDSYELVSKTDKDRKANENALIAFINSFHARYPHAKLIINRGFNIIDKVHQDVEAVLFESYYNGIGGDEGGYTELSASDRAWLDLQISKVKKYNLSIIDVDYLPYDQLQNADKLVQKIKQKGLIPYVSTKELNVYGRSSKNAIKRELLTMISERSYGRRYIAAHLMGQLPAEYLGYILKYREIFQEGLPKLEEMSQYGGVIIWLSDYYNKPDELINWVVSVQKLGIKVIFANNFGIQMTSSALEPLGIKLRNVEHTDLTKNKIVTQDPMMNFEIQPTTDIPFYLQPQHAQALFELEDKNKNKSVLAAITPWGGYALNNGLMSELGEDNLWTINPFEFFAKALDLKAIAVPDTTTENGNRLLFSHLDGDAFINKVEWNPNLFAAEVIYKEILQTYQVPHSISIVGAEIFPDGLYPELSSKLMEIARKIYALPNVEGASHTFSHPFIWAKIKDQQLDEKYRLAPKGYQFSYDKELVGTIDEINSELMPKNKPQDKLARTVFWSGDCVPIHRDLEYLYKHNILNINGGDTTITDSSPWISNVAPNGLERGDYYQIYTGAQDENVYTNDWSGPFWGYKKVIQTFERTNSPRRFKPTDIYYHFYSGSKRASLNALTYVFDWALKQEVLPIFTSEYIPKAMDFYTASLADENGSWLAAGMKDIHTLRIERSGESFDLDASKGIVGFKNIENHTYYHLDLADTHLLTPSKTRADRFYLIDSNAKISKSSISAQHSTLTLKGHVDLKLHLHLPSSCSLVSTPKASNQSFNAFDSTLYLNYSNMKEATLDVTCK